MPINIPILKSAFMPSFFVRSCISLSEKNALCNTGRAKSYSEKTIGFMARIFRRFAMLKARAGLKITYINLKGASQPIESSL